MKKEHQDKMADLARREEEAKKQVYLFFFYFILFVKFRLQLGNKCIVNGWQRWKDELIIYKLQMKNFK